MLPTGYHEKHRRKFDWHRLTLLDTQPHPLSVPTCRTKNKIKLGIMFNILPTLKKFIRISGLGSNARFTIMNKQGYEWLLPKSRAGMASELRKRENHDIFICWSWNCCIMRPEIGMIIDGFGMGAFKHCLFQQTIWIVR